MRSLFKHIIVDYAGNPNLFRIHLTKGLRVLFKEGPQQVIRRARTAVGGAQQRSEYKRLLSARKTNAVKMQSELLHWLLPYAEDLTVLDVLHDETTRLRAIHCHILKKHSLFDEEFYVQNYKPDVQVIRPIDHYITHGLGTGNWPNALFDPLEYLITYPDIMKSGIDPVVHYSLFGWREGRSSGSYFDGDRYLRENPDVIEAGISPLYHYLAFGRHENRLADTVQKRTHNRETLIIVSHDAEIGGAQKIVEVFSKWLLDTTNFDIKLVIMRGGNNKHTFSSITSVFDIESKLIECKGNKEEVAEQLTIWAGSNVKAVFINSVGSAKFLHYWNEPTPVVAYLHELTKIIEEYGDTIDLIRERAKSVLCGSHAVRNALCENFDFEPEKCHVVYDFVEAVSYDEGNIEARRIKAKTKYGIEPDHFTVMGCGTLHWRKSPEKFIEIAKKVSLTLTQEVRFVWIGDGPDMKHCEKLIAREGLEKIVKFVGYQSDVKGYIEAADLFLLPSEEDPFPLVCLYAALAEVPVVCFEEAGGMPEFVSMGCGVAVPYLDVNAMADAVVAYTKDENRRRQEGAAGRKLVEESYTIHTTGPQLLHYLREAGGLIPHVSVVVPNYNYEDFLAERLQSIAKQSFQDFDVILLDDNSKDGSVEILEAWAKKRPGTQVIVNKVNSGSPCAQWIRGMRAASSDLIWIAEADDDCKPELLSTLLPYFEDRNVFLGFVKSVPVDKDGKVLGDYEDFYLNRIADGRWSKPFIATDHEEVCHGLGIANSIPNASSVVFRRFDPEPNFEESLTNMRMCGDWYFYLRAMRGGLVAYSNLPLNSHRRHSLTITSQTEGSLRYFEELATIRNYVDSTYRLDQSTIERIENFIKEDLDRFKVTDDKLRYGILKCSLPKNPTPHLPTLIIVVPDLSPGGGQIFGIRLANAWQRNGGRVVLFNVRHFPDHPQVYKKIDPRVVLYHANNPADSFADLVHRFGVDIIHSSIWWADRYVQESIDALPNTLPWVITMHGCYETLLDNPELDSTFPERFKKMLKRVNAWVYIAEKNRDVFDVYGHPSNQLKILNGVEIEQTRPLSRKELGLRTNAIVLCLASRAIESKGWFEAVEATRRLNAAGHAVDLILLGEGSAADTIREKKYKHVHLYGHVSNVHDYIEVADIGLLPSYFKGESMPLVLLELMAKGKPVVATDIGEIPDIIGTGTDAAGIIVPLKKHKVDLDDLVEALTELIDNGNRQRVGHNAKIRFEERFNINQMLENYSRLYCEVCKTKNSELKQ